MNLSNVPDSINSSNAGLCKRGRPGRFKCGDHGVKSIAFDGAWHPSCWFLETACSSASHDSNRCACRLLITECVTSQPLASRLQKLIDTCSWTASENSFTQWQDLFPVFLSTNLLVRGHSCVSSHIVSSENPCCASDRPRKHRRVCCHFKRRDFVLERTARYVLASPRTEDTAYSATLMAVSVTLAVEFASLALQDDILLPLCPAATEELLLLSPCRQKRSYPRSRTHLAAAATT